VAGATTLIGSALFDHLEQSGFTDVIPATSEPDLTDALAVDGFFASNRPEFVFLAAGRSGGIAANQLYPAELMRDNLLVACNIIHSAHGHGVQKLVYLASSCSYPRLASQPLVESSLLTGPLEPTNEAYALAKIAGMKLCNAYRQQYGCRFASAIPANAFGPGDDFRLEESHVIAALIRKVHDAKVHGGKTVKIWGSGAPRRDFIFAPDLADACVWVMDHYDENDPINLGSGNDLSIRELAEAVCKVVSFAGNLEFDTTKPDGMPRKALDSSKLYQLGWRPRVNFEKALAQTYAWFVQHELPKELTHA
jgi:GDP-L-fucose synthase